MEGQLIVFLIPGLAVAVAAAVFAAWGLSLEVPAILPLRFFFEARVALDSGAGGTSFWSVMGSWRPVLIQDLFGGGLHFAFFQVLFFAGGAAVASPKVPTLRALLGRRFDQPAT